MEKSPATPDPERFELEVERGPNGSVILSVSGDVDLHSAPQLRDRLEAAIDEGVRKVVVDLDHATFLDSMALGVLLGAKKSLEGTDSALDLVVTSSDIRRIFEITMLDRVFELHSTRREAVGVGGR
jgi:anti-sigma B factor antagonist